MPAVLAAVRTVRPTVPVILLVGPGEEHRTATWIRTGVEEVVRRDAVGHAVEAVQRALEARQPLSRLSPRQIEVLRLITDGLTSREIASGLRLSEKTVETHRSAVAQRSASATWRGWCATRCGSASPPWRLPSTAGAREAGAGLAASPSRTRFPGD